MNANSKSLAIEADLFARRPAADCPSNRSVGLKTCITQDDHELPTLAQEFEKWKNTRGGAHIMNHAYRMAAGYAARYKKTNRPVSIALIWELLRDRVDWISEGLKKRGIKMERHEGFALSNSFRAYAARHMMERNPEWSGMFILRSVGNKSRKIRTIILDNRTENNDNNHS